MISRLMLCRLSSTPASTHEANRSLIAQRRRRKVPVRSVSELQADRFADAVASIAWGQPPHFSTLPAAGAGLPEDAEGDACFLDQESIALDVVDSVPGYTSETASYPCFGDRSFHPLIFKSFQVWHVLARTGFGGNAKTAMLSWVLQV